MLRTVLGGQTQGAYAYSQAEGVGTALVVQEGNGGLATFGGRGSLLVCGACVVFQFVAGADMARKCALCGKAPQYGNVISHAHNVRRRRWNPNLRRVRAIVDGARKRVLVCTACIRAGRVRKAS